MPERPRMNTEGPSEHSLWSRLKPKLHMGVLLLTLFGVPGKSRAEEPLESPDGDQITVVEKAKRFAKKAARSGTEVVSNLYTRELRMSEDGTTVEFNPWALLAPIQTEVGASEPEAERIAFELPYEYARLFDEAAIKNPEDRERVVQYIERRLREELAQSLYFLDFSNNTRGVYRAHHRPHGDELTESFGRVGIESLRISGFASPEGPEKSGPATLRPGAVDQENVELARRRATDIEPSVREALERLGARPDQLAAIDASELQFSDAEIHELVGIADAQKISGKDDIAKIFYLVRAYNDGSLKEGGALDRLDHIVGTKRMVKVEIVFKGGEKGVVVVPLPLTALLILTLPFLVRRRRDRDTDRGPSVGKRRLRETFLPTIPEDVAPPTAPSESISQRFAELFRGADTLRTPIDRHRMERIMFREIHRYLDRHEGVARLIPYRHIIERWAAGYSPQTGQFIGRTDEGVVFDLANALLDMWQKNDRMARGMMGIEYHAADTSGSDYRIDPNKVAWAKIAAQQVIAAVKIYTTKPQRFNREMDRIVRSLEET